MKLQTVPARQGTRWVRQGFRIFFARPMAFAGLFAAFMFAMLVLLLLPYLGSLLVLAILPLGSLGFMIATREVVEGRLPKPSVFLLPLRRDKSRRNALIQLGIAYMLCVLAISALTDLVDGGALGRMMDSLHDGQGTPEETAEQLVNGGVLAAMLLRVALVALVSVPFWHAPALIFWDRHGCAKALFSSTAACWSNRGAFAVFGCSWFAVIALSGLALNIVFGLLGGTQLLSYVLPPVSLILSTIFYTSLYFTFADSFSPSEPPALSAASLTT